MKLLIVASCLDLRLPHGGAVTWWQLLMALYAQGVDLKVTVYQGRMVPSLWWESYENPCYWEGYLYAALKTWRARWRPAGARAGTGRGRAALAVARAGIRPRWRTHLRKILRAHPDTDAVLLVNLPLNQLQGIPTDIHERFGIPVIYYDSDLPVSLPRSRGFSSGFRIYEDADIGEYDLIVGNSLGGLAELKALGAKRVAPLFFAANPRYFCPLPGTAQDLDVFFYGLGDEYRRDWMRWMVSEPSVQMPQHTFAVRGQRITVDLGNARLLTDVPLSRLRETCNRSRINLNIVRSGHATAYGTSTTRPIEMAAMACCVVSSPYPGVEEWFEPGKEILLVRDREEVVDLYRWLLAHDDVRREVGRRARQRVLQEHTHAHRAKQLIEIIRDVRG